MRTEDLSAWLDAHRGLLARMETEDAVRNAQLLRENAAARLAVASGYGMTR